MQSRLLNSPIYQYDQAMCWTVWFCLLLLTLVGRANPVLQTAPDSLRVLKSADTKAPIIYVIPAGTNFWVFDKQDEFTRIKYKRAKHWQTGFIKAEDLPGADTTTLVEPTVSAPKRYWALSVVGMLSHLQQGGKAFVTDDQVEYQLTGYHSQTVWPSLMLQVRQVNFWRLAIGSRTTNYQGQAVTDVGRNSRQTVTLRHRMLDVSLERAFSLYGGCYVSAGLDYAHASSYTITYNGRGLSTATQDLPNYLGLAIALGDQYFVGERISIFAALRGVAFVNQTPAIYGAELSGGGGFWF